MVQLTRRASADLRRLLTDNFARPQQGIRLRLNEAGGLGMTIDVPNAGDSIVRRDNLPVLIVDGRLSARLAERVLEAAILSARRNESTIAMGEIGKRSTASFVLIGRERLGAPGLELISR